MAGSRPGGYAIRGHRLANYTRARVSSQGRLLGLARGARVDAVAYPAAAELAARACGRGRVRRTSAEPIGDRHHPRLQRGGGDRAPAREPARARLPAREARDRRRVRRLERPHERARRGGRRARAAGAACSTARAVARWRRRTGPCARRRARSSPSPTANATWAPDALRQLVANLADPEVAYVCGQLRLADAAGTNREGIYWRYEMKLREAESRLGSITGGNGSIYAVKRADYVEVDPRWGHDLSFPYRMVQEGRRAVYEPAAHAFEKPTPSNETEYRRKVRMFEHCWEITLRGSMFRRLPPGYLVEIVSHRLLRYGSGILHLALLASSVALVGRRLGLRDRARGPGGADRRRRGRRADRPLLRARHLGDGRRALELPAARRSRDVGGGGGNAVNRALDVVGAAARARGRRARCSPRRRSRSSSRTAARCSSARRGSARTAQDFELLKLRTMVVGAEKQGRRLRRRRRATAGSRASGGSCAARRSTSCRSSGTSLRGEMSLIGPRPTLRYQVDTYTARQRKRLDVRPGLTGWAQVHGRATLPWDGADRARRLVRRAPLAARRPEDPAADAARALRRHLPWRDGRLAGRRCHQRPTAVRPRPRGEAPLTTD